MQVYVRYTCQHLFQRTDEHKYFTIGKHLRDKQNVVTTDLQQFKILTPRETGMSVKCSTLKKFIHCSVIKHGRRASQQ